MKQVIIDSEAEYELSESVNYYERRVPGLGLALERTAREAVATIQADPHRHALQQDGTRRFVMERFPFVIHYFEMADTIWVLAFAHTSRKPGYWRRRETHLALVKYQAAQTLSPPCSATL